MIAIQREILTPENAPKALGPYSSGFRSGDWVFTSGMIGIDPETGKLREGGIETETEQVMANLESILQAGGSSLAQVLKTTVFLTDLEDFTAMNRVYGRSFTSEPPARSTVQVAGLPGGALIMIDAVALIDEAVGD